HWGRHAIANNPTTSDGCSSWNVPRYPGWCRRSSSTYDCGSHGQRPGGVFGARGKIELVAIHEFDASAKMILQIDRRYYGISCRERKLKMTYVSQTFADAAFGVHFSVGQEILFILHERPDVTQRYNFNSAFRGGIDLAFRGTMLPPYFRQAEEPTFTSIY